MSLVCGLKLTHDSGVALIDDGDLKFNVEYEKINNNNRFAIADSLDSVTAIINSEGYEIEEIDYFVIDGWIGETEGAILINGSHLRVAPYLENNNYFLGINFNGLPFSQGRQLSYLSYPHVAGHVIGSYMSSPFAQEGKSSYVLVWDGGMYPRLYFVNPKSRIVFLGCLFSLASNIYSVFSQHFGVFKLNPNVIKDELSISGKVMAYVALGKVDERILKELELTYHLFLSLGQQLDFHEQALIFTSMFQNQTTNKGFSDEDIISSFHFFLEQKLIEGLLRLIPAGQRESDSICLSGGAALNIKWNSRIRSSKVFDSVWVCPFPNDSGSAIGAACCQLYFNQHYRNLTWNVYSGPNLLTNKESFPGWKISSFSIFELAALLLHSNEPVVFLSGRSEIGPRALGHRSIFISPFNEKGKKILNYLKDRENFRPIAPICLEERAKEFFNPGIPDPYMLFEHVVKKEFALKIKAIAHIDNTARLQTISKSQEPQVYKLLECFGDLSGIPVLGNTSANFKGRGFFPDVKSAIKWGKVNYIWSNGFLYEKIHKNEQESLFN